MYQDQFIHDTAVQLDNKIYQVQGSYMILHYNFRLHDW